MKYKIFYILLLLLFTDITNADVGDPWVQAICKVTLSNGKAIEGLIKLGTGGNGLWMNGFNVETNYGQQRNNIQFLFDLNFRFILFTDSLIVHNNSTTNVKGEKVRIRFMQWVANPSIYEPVKYLTTDDSIVIIKHLERHYLFLDSITIYTDMTSVTFLDTVDELQEPPKRIKVIKIATRDIAKFELIEHPNKSWLDKIETANIKFNQVYNGENSTGDGQAAAWFHEMIAKKELYEYYQPRIDFFIGEFPK